MNVKEIKKTFEVFYPDGGLVEIRSFSKSPLSGYFKDHKNLLDCISKYPNETFYFVMNEISDGCYGRDQHEKIMAVGRKENTTGDKDITKRHWILVDADPKRTAGTSSTDEEKEHAKATIGKVYYYLKNIGYQEPIVADSGNGYHLLYRVNIDIQNNYTEAIKKFLLALDMMFADENVNIDTSVFNASRITKLYGVMAAKGANTKERPHRISRILRVPETITPTSIKLIEKIAAIVPVEQVPTYRNNYNGERFDIEAFISKHGISVSKKGTWSGGTKYVLENCVFDQNHKSPDAAICVGSGGAIGYHCFHNSCQGLRWQDVRLKFEPNAYDREREYQQTRTTNPNSVTREQLFQSKPIDKNTEESYPFKRMKDIMPLDRSKLVVAKSGFTELDNAIIGHNKGELSIWSGGTGCVDCDTEYFNGDRWKRISEYNSGDKVLQYNYDGTAELSMPITYYKHPAISLREISNQTKSLYQCVSDNHNIVYVTTRGNIQKRPFSEIAGLCERKYGFHGSIITAFSYSGSGIELSDDMIRLMIAISADGHFPSHLKTKYCRINLKNQCKKDRLESLLVSCGIPYRKKNITPKDLEFDTYTFKAPHKWKVFPREWHNMNNRQMKIFMDEITRWDGSITTKGGRVYSTIEKQNADIVQFIYSANGYRTSIKEDSRSGNTCFIVHVQKNKQMVSLHTQRKITVRNIPTKDGYQYCFEVQSGMLILRKGNTINITGNSGKSTILSQLALNNIHQGFNVALFSGELRNSRVKDWFMLQAAGRQYVKPSTYHKGYYVPHDIVKQIEEWSADKIWVYDNDKGVSADNVLDSFKRHIEKYQTDVVIIDNMMSLDMVRIHGDKYERQTSLVLALSDMVKRYNIHVHFVCHPRKPTGFLRKADISGTADITNAADNVFMMHRVNNDFKRFAKDFLTESVAKEYYEYTNVMEVMKNRDLGIEDLLIGFLYEPESRRMLNERQENIIYGWNTTPYYRSPHEGFTEIPDDDLPEEWRTK